MVSPVVVSYLPQCKAEKIEEKSNKSEGSLKSRVQLKGVGDDSKHHYAIALDSTAFDFQPQSTIPKLSWYEKFRHIGILEIQTEAEDGTKGAKGYIKVNTESLRKRLGFTDKKAFYQELERNDYNCTTMVRNNLTSRGAKPVNKETPLNDYFDIIKEGRYSEALVFLQKQEKEGNAEAAKLLGDLFLTGMPETGIKPNFKQALEHYKRAAEAGNAEAMYKLSNLYKEGKGVSKNEKLYLKFLNLAANMGNKKATIDLANYYHNKEFNPELANQNSQDHSRGEIYMRAAGIFEKDINFGGKLDALSIALRRSIAFYVDAKRHEIPGAEEKLETLKKQKDDYEKTRSHIKEGNPQAMHDLGLRYIEGSEYLKQDVGKGIELLKQAADRDHADSIIKLARLCKENGIQSISEEELGQAYYKAAIELEKKSFSLYPPKEAEEFLELAIQKKNREAINHRPIKSYKPAESKASSPKEAADIGVIDKTKQIPPKIKRQFLADIKNKRSFGAALKLLRETGFSRELLEGPAKSGYKNNTNEFFAYIITEGTPQDIKNLAQLCKDKNLHEIDKQLLKKLYLAASDLRHNLPDEREEYVKLAGAIK